MPETSESSHHPYRTHMCGALRAEDVNREIRLAGCSFSTWRTRRYGTDKPDPRNPIELAEVTDLFEDSRFCATG